MDLLDSNSLGVDPEQPVTTVVDRDTVWPEDVPRDNLCHLTSIHADTSDERAL